MNCSELLRHYKTKAAIAAAGNIDRQAVQGWFERGRVPVEQQMKYEVDTAGLLKADISEEFRKVVKRGAKAA